MAEYIYTAKGRKGETLKGVIDSRSEGEAAQKLREKGMYPVSIKLQTVANRDIKISLPQKIKVKDIALMCRQFYSMLDSGISILECVEVLRRQTENRKLAQSLEEVYQKLQKGQTLSASMRQEKGIYPEILINMVEAGEVSGQIDVIMNRMAVHFEKENSINRKIQSAMTYPVIVISIAVLVVWFLISFVLPSFIDMFSGAGVQLPLLTRMLLKVGEFTKNYWYIVFGALLGGSYVLGKYLRTDEGRYQLDRFKLAFPIIKEMNTKVATSRFSRTLSTLMASGVPIIQAMGIVKKVIGNAVIAKSIDSVMDDIKRGEGLANPLAALKVFPPMLISMIKVGEESGKLSDMLEKSADYYDAEVDDAITRMTTILEPVLIIVMAVIIGTIVMAIVLPMFDMFQHIG
ncbi:type IV pilus assembly protein PilC [Peptoclostridium litorale DSM 5388]|uniref:Type 4 fimbrial assembly protein PilC n=1 Tax=Peptoclostridium litorale DSM 5388 TaxID=1121324 RepID=A0A069R9U5_PEPLI|nr:type II secretion system F family protein [Peptoclostridium litorale]KDR93811.1 type 4 fimbrial assembly protein PilC [Peptoclostridium litorale DSM 5388]SIN86297.1 type IV pilus assembly protein PilC [Peptoclostridium litorale DSM 5388]